jgi:hypothetical protein
LLQLISLTDSSPYEVAQFCHRSVVVVAAAAIVFYEDNKDYHDHDRF